jgi:hypothetical protein
MDIRPFSKPPKRTLTHVPSGADVKHKQFNCSENVKQPIKSQLHVK